MIHWPQSPWRFSIVVFLCRYCMLCSQSLTQKCRKCPTIDKNPFKKFKKKLDSYQNGICLAPTRNFNPNPAIVIWVTRPMHKHTNQNLEKKTEPYNVFACQWSPCQGLSVVHHVCSVLSFSKHLFLSFCSLRPINDPDSHQNWVVGCWFRPLWLFLFFFLTDTPKGFSLEGPDEPRETSWHQSLILWQRGTLL